MWFGLIGKTAEERKQQNKTERSLQEQLAELRAEKAALETKAAKLEAKNEELKQAHVKGARNAFEGGVRRGREEMRSQLTEEGWKERTGFKDLPKQEQMAKFLTHLVEGKILPQEQDKALKTLQDLMKSESVDVMRPQNSYTRDCLLEEFLQKFYNRDIRKDDQDFYRRVFKVILNARGKNGPKADITSHLPHRKNPLIGYFGAIQSLRPFLDTALESAAFDMEKFDYQHFRQVFGNQGGYYTWEVPKMRKTLLLHGFDPEKEGCTEWFKDEQAELLAEGKLKAQPDKKKISKTIQAIHQMSVREMRKALEQQAQVGTVTIVEPTPTPKKRTTRKAVGKGGRG